MAMNKRRSRFATGVLLLASMLFGSTIAHAQAPEKIAFRESETTKTTNTITVFWDTPGSGMSALVDFQLEYTDLVLDADKEEIFNPDQQFTNNIPVAAGAIQMHTLRGLKAGTKYAIKVRAQNRNQGYGVWSTGPNDDTDDTVENRLVVQTAPAAGTGPIDAAAPDKVVFHNETTETASTIRFTWVTPGSGRSALIDYQLEYMEVGGDTAFTNNFIPPNGQATQSETIDGLMAATRYQIRLRAQNRVAGYGPWSDYLYATTDAADAGEEAGTPGAPEKVAIRTSETTSTTTTITFSWVTPGSGLSALIDYQLEYMEVGRSATFTNNIAPEAGATQDNTITGLKVDTEYEIKLRAQNRTQGYGLWSDTHNFSTKAVATAPDAPPVSKMAPPMVEAGDKMLMVSWAEPASEKSISHYQVDYKTASAAKWMDKPMNITAMNYTIKGLINGTAYLVRVRAVDSAGNMGVWSDNGSGTPMMEATPTPALPLFGAFGLGAGLLAVGRARMRRQAQLRGRREQRQMTR
jgi:hypothetical protein